MKCIIGGTFSSIHAGHTRLFEAALAFPEWAIGLTSNRFAKEMKIYPIVPYAERKNKLSAFILALLKKRKSQGTKFEIFEISDSFGGADEIGADAIIVSDETERKAEEINLARVAKKKKPLRIISVPIAYAEDYLKISSTRIFKGAITPEGKRRTPVIFALGTANPSKKQGLEKAAARLFKKFKIKAMKVKSGISEQPFEQETVQGAENRARAAYAASGCDFGIGFESGIFKMGSVMHDIAICAVFDGEKTTFGNSMGFQMPPEALDLLSAHKDLGEAMEAISGISKIGQKGGAIQFLSAGLLTREEMNEQAFLCAMIPRISEAKGILKY